MRIDGSCVAATLITVSRWLHLRCHRGRNRSRPGLGRYAAAVASYFATGAALPPVPDSPRLRRGQLEQLKIALPWAFGLPRTRAARTGPVTAINTDQSFDQGVAQSAAL